MDSELIRDIWVITQVILLDLALGGDNSIIIGMAAKNLPHDLRRKAILYGTAGAILLRFIMAGRRCHITANSLLEDSRRAASRLYRHETYR